MGSNFFQNVNNGISNAGIRINDDRGNPLNLPINQQQPTGIYRTFVNSNNPGNVMVKLNDGSEENNNPLGFTPEEAFFIKGTQSIDPISGFPTEKGNVSSLVSLNNNSTEGKIFRTDLSWSPSNASPLDDTLHGNQLRLTGNHINSDSRSSAGFTDPLDYVINTDDININIPGLTGTPRELGDNPTNIKPNFNKNNPIYTDPYTLLNGDGVNIKGAKNIYSSFNNIKQFNFLHNLDGPLENGSGQSKGNIDQKLLANPKAANEIYLGSFIRTADDNEDPTMFGYDVSIIVDTSPLFNGSIISFINQFTSEQEVESRREVWIAFCNQLFKFFGVDHRSFLPYTLDRWSNGTTASTSTNNQLDASGSPSAFVYDKNSGAQKAYYLKKISGLDKLVEGEISSTADAVKTMVDYGKDMIKLSVWEDVSVNMGYLSTLYKTLSWSRFNGKQIIPENLLRFDVDITITEIRQYNRVIKDNQTKGNLGVYVDNLAKYKYSLYDCQFKFERLSHGDQIDMSATKIVEDFDLEFTYKYSTLHFSKFSFSGTQSKQTFIENAQPNVLDVSPTIATNTKIQSGSLKNYMDSSGLIRYDYLPKNSDTYIPSTSKGTSDIITQQKINESQKTVSQFSSKWDNYKNSSQSTLDKANQNHSTNNLLSNLGKKLNKSVVHEVNRQITTQAKLLNNTLDNIRNSVGSGRMSAPTNFYNGNTLFRNEMINSVRDFVGQSVRSFFTPVTQDSGSNLGPRES